MAYGVEVQNQNGIIQFSTETAGLYTRLLSGSVTVAAGDLYGPSNALINVSASIPAGVTNEDVLFAFRSTSGAIGYALSVGDAGYYRIYNSDTGSNTYEYCVFMKSSEQTTPSSGYGLNVFDTDGTTLKFSSEYPPLSVETVLDIDLTSTGADVDYSHDTSSGLGLPWVLASASMGSHYQGTYSWEELENGDGTGDGEYEYLVVFWGTTVTTIGAYSRLVDGVTEPDFYNTIGAEYNDGKVVILRGYNYNP